MNFTKIFAALVFSYIALSPSLGIAQTYRSFSCWADNVFDKKTFIFETSGKSLRMVSPFHDVKLSRKKNIYNMVVEIPQGTTEKIEINKAESFNPLMYDIRDDKVRKITYKAKHSKVPGYPFHYGALPQTWEHVGILDSHTKMHGDNDPIDAFDISSIKRKPGDIIAVKVLGAIAMIDNKETDWKLITVNLNDNMATKYKNLNDVPKQIIDTIYDFLLNYKTSEGKPQNEFYEKVYWSKSEALNIILETHRNWQKLCDDPEGTRAIVQKNRPDKLKEVPSCKNPKRLLKNVREACIID